MDPPGRLEVYIPAEAEVKNIPLSSLPNSVLRRMGLPLSDSKGSTKHIDSPQGMWICPVTLRRKGQKPVENMLSLLGKEFRAASGPQRMSFVSSNRTAYEVLRDLPGKKVSAYRPHSSLSPQASAPHMHRSAVVIYQGNIYLTIRKPNRSQRQLTAQASTSSSKSQRKELLNNNRPRKKHTMCKVTKSDNKKDATHKVRAVSPSRNAHSVPQSTGSVHKVDSHRHNVKGEQVAEEVDPTQFKAGGEQEEMVASEDTDGREMQDLDGEEAESSSQNHGEDNQGSTKRELLTAAHASMSPLKEFDFEQLAQEEMITRMKARLRQNEAALNTYPSL